MHQIPLQHKLRALSNKIDCVILRRYCFRLMFTEAAQITLIIKYQGWFT
jgi:hypothetical protein